MESLTEDSPKGKTIENHSYRPIDREPYNYLPSSIRYGIIDLINDGIYTSKEADACAIWCRKMNDEGKAYEAVSILQTVEKDPDWTMFDYSKDAIDKMGFYRDGRVLDYLDLEKRLKKEIGESKDLSVAINDSGGFQAITITKSFSPERSYSFTLNMCKDNPQITFLAFHSASALRLAFWNELESPSLLVKLVSKRKEGERNPFIESLFEFHPRTGIQVPKERKIFVQQQEEKFFRREQRIRRQEQQLAKNYHPESLFGWHTTDPQKHNPNNFRYFIHAVAGEFQSVSLALARTSMALAGEEDIERTHGNVFSNVGDFLQREYISASVIDQMHRITWSSAGVILNVPKENILLANSQDMGTIPNKNFFERNRKPLSPNVANILKETSPYGYNEVLISARDPRTNQKVKITGVFIIINSRTGLPEDSKLSDRARKFAKDLGLPIVEVLSPLR